MPLPHDVAVTAAVMVLRSASARAAGASARLGGICVFLFAAHR